MIERYLPNFVKKSFYTGKFAYNDSFFITPVFYRDDLFAKSLPPRGVFRRTLVLPNE